MRTACWSYKIRTVRVAAYSKIKTKNRCHMATNHGSTGALRRSRVRLFSRKFYAVFRCIPLYSSREKNGVSKSRTVYYNAAQMCISRISRIGLHCTWHRKWAPPTSCSCCLTVVQMSTHETGIRRHRYTLGQLTGNSMLKKCYLSRVRT